MKNTLKPSIPIPVKRALLKLGKDIRNARRKRRISTAIFLRCRNLGFFN